MPLDRTWGKARIYPVGWVHRIGSQKVGESSCSKAHLRRLLGESFESEVRIALLPVRNGPHADLLMAQAHWNRGMPKQALIPSAYRTRVCAGAVIVLSIVALCVRLVFHATLVYILCTTKCRQGLSLLPLSSCRWFASCVSWVGKGTFRQDA